MSKFTKIHAAKMVGNYDGNNPKLYTERLVGNVRACIGFTKTSNQINVPNTVLNVDLRTISNMPLRVIATYRKRYTDTSYSELVYNSKKINWASITYPLKWSNIPKPN